MGKGRHRMVLPFAPVEELMYRRYERRLTLPELVEVLGMSVRSLRRFRSEGVPYLTADKLAIAAGLHPWHVWGDLWWCDLWLIEDEEDDVNKTIWLVYEPGVISSGSQLVWRGQVHRVASVHDDTYVLDNGQSMTFSPGDAYEVPEEETTSGPLT